MQSTAILATQAVARDHVELLIAHPQADQHTQAGQFIKLTVGDLDPGFFAIASAPGAAQMRILVQAASPLTAALCALSPGERVSVSAPMGSGFALELLKGHTPLFFATGSGISAIRSALESRDWTGTGARLYYGAQSLERMAWRDQFPAWEARGVKVIPVLSRESGPWTGATGHIQDVYAQSPAQNPGLVLCGVKAMCVSATELLVSQGMPKELALLNF